MILKRIIFELAAVILMAAGISPAAIKVKAENKADYEQSNVLDDLENSTINGEPFDLEKYNFDTKKDTEVLTFVEYCYGNVKKSV